MTIYNENNVPIVYRGPDQRIGLSTESHELLEKAKAAAAKAIEADGPDAYDKHLLLAHSVVIQNPAPLQTDEPGQTVMSIGASTLDEALKEVIAAYDLSHVGQPGQTSDSDYTPEWVASTHKDLGALLADYYSCEQREIAEVI